MTSLDVTIYRSLHLELFSHTFTSHEPHLVAILQILLLFCALLAAGAGHSDVFNVCIYCKMLISSGCCEGANSFRVGKQTCRSVKTTLLIGKVYKKKNTQQKEFVNELSHRAGEQ